AWGGPAGGSGEGGGAGRAGSVPACPWRARPAAVLEAVYPFDVSRLIAEEVEATSADGTSVPLSILRRKDLVLDGSHPAILYGYGGYRISQGPWVSSPGLARLPPRRLFPVSPPP